MGQRNRRQGFAFRVRETEVVDRESVERGLAVWADYLARRLTHPRPNGEGLKGTAGFEEV